MLDPQSSSSLDQGEERSKNKLLDRRRESVVERKRKDGCELEREIKNQCKPGHASS
jgi:hypothetical protein